MNDTVITAALPAISIGAAVSLVPIAAAAFAVTGMVLGASVCTSVGASASAVAGGLKEQDRRMLEDMLEEGKHISKSFKPDIDDPHPKTGFFQQFTQGSNKLFKWKVAAFGLAAGAMAGGVLIAAAAAGMSLPVVGAMSSMVGATLFGSGALGAAELAVVGQAISTMAITGTALFGAVFGFDMPTIATNTMNLMGKLLSGEAFESKEEARTRAINPDITKKLSEARQQPAKPAPAENTGVTAEEAKTLDQRLLATKHPSMFQQKEEQRKALSVSPGQGASI